MVIYTNEAPTNLHASLKIKTRIQFNLKINILLNFILVEIRNLYLFETIDSILLADKLNKSCQAKNGDKLLNVMVQVNTSGEARKLLKFTIDIHFIEFTLESNRKGWC